MQNVKSLNIVELKFPLAGESFKKDISTGILLKIYPHHVILQLSFNIFTVNAHCIYFLPYSI